MNATSTNSSVGTRLRHARPVDPLGRRRDMPLRDIPAPPRRGRHVRRDDGSHTPPHGDAVLYRRKSPR